MLIFGTRSTKKLLDKGTFSCPQCQNAVSYEKRRAKNWFHLYFIPVIPLKEYPPYVECKSCSATFVEGVLNAGSQADSEAIRAEFEVAALEILARMALADNVVEPEEIEEILSVVNSICAREYNRDDVLRAIDAAKGNPEDALAIATRVGHTLNDAGKETVLRAVFLVAAADGDFAKEEQEMLLEIGAGLGLRPAHIRGLIAEMMQSQKPANA